MGLLEEMIARGGRPVRGFGVGSLAPPAALATAGISSMALALAGSAVSAATGWAMERALVRMMGGAPTRRWP
jgi:hypothetical protein